MEEVQKKGYLEGDYRLFYLKTLPEREIEPHYHDFHKVLLLLKGQIGYSIEGRSYPLLPGDVVLVGAGEIHNPVFQGKDAYERVILYLSPSYGSLFGEEAEGLLRFFEREERRAYLLRPQGNLQSALSRLTQELLSSWQEVWGGGEEAPFARLYQRLKVTELMILLSQAAGQEGRLEEMGVQSSPAVDDCIRYISSHLQEDLSVETIASALFLSKSYLMHRFKDQTGMTIGEFIREKRLFSARKALAEGASVTDACYLSGFKNYSSFYYAYKKKYGHAPREGMPLMVSSREE